MGSEVPGAAGSGRPVHEGEQVWAREEGGALAVRGPGDLVELVTRGDALPAAGSCLWDCCLGGEGLESRRTGTKNM